MKTGPKPLPPSVKRARGTYQPCRDDDKTALINVNDPPLQPDGLSPRAQGVWEENLIHAMAAGVCSLDGALFANYCELQAAVRLAWASGSAPPISALVELRRISELFGLAGPKSRVVRIRPNEINPFAQLDESKG